MHNSLLAYSSPREDEGAQGYLLRLANLNGYDGVTGFKSARGLKGAIKNLLNTHESLSVGFGLSVHDANLIKNRFSEELNWKGYYRGLYDAVCPDCIGTDSHLRGHWSHTLCLSCPTHKVRLIDRCDHCNSPIRKDRSFLHSCQCGMPLKDLQRTPSSDFEDWLSLIIQTKHSKDGPEGFPVIEGVDLSTVEKLIRTLAVRYELSDERSSRGVGRNLTETSEVFALLEPIQNLFANWPQNFTDHLRARFSEASEDKRTVKGALGYWYTVVSEIVTDTPFQEILNLAEQVGVRDFDLLSGLKGNRDSVAEFSGRYKVKDAALLLRVSGDKLLSAIHGGLVNAQAFKFGRNRFVYEIEQSTIDEILLKKSSWVSFDIIKERFGLTESTIKNMANAGVVRLDKLWQRDIFKGGPISLTDFELFDQRLRQKVNCGNVRTADLEVISLSELTARRFGQDKAIQRVFRAICDEQIEPLALGKTLGDIVFRKVDVTVYFGQPLLEVGLTVPQLQKQFGYKWESVKSWIDDNYLAAHSTLRSGQPCFVVMPSDLAEFKRKFIPLAELAKSLGKKPSALASQFDGFIPLFGGRQVKGKNGKYTPRGRLVRVEDLLKLTLLGIESSQNMPLFAMK